MTKVHMHEHFDKDGNLTFIEVVGTDDKHVLDIMWDENDEQTHENRQKFREWAQQILKRYNLSIIE